MKRQGISTWWCLLCVCSYLNCQFWSVVAFSVEDDSKSLPTDLIVRIHCPSDLLNKDMHASCINSTQKISRGFKLSAFYHYKQEIAAKAISTGFTEESERASYDAFLEKETTLANYHRKLSIVQDIADNHRVRKIGVVGFRAGLALTNLIVANPQAQFVVFDPLSESKYSLHHFQHVQQTHPSREITLIAGEIHRSLRDFTRQFPKQKFQVLFLDLAGLVNEALISNILSASLALVDPVFNRVLVNDFEFPAVNTAFQYVYQKVRTGLLCPTCDQPALALLPPRSDECDHALRSNITVVAYYKGFQPTPCVLMYANETETKHKEFLFSMHHCMPAETQEVPQPPFDDFAELLVAQLSSSYVEPQ